MSSEIAGRSYIQVSGKRVAELARASLGAISAHRGARRLAVYTSTIAAYRTSLGYRWDRWWGQVWGRWTEPTDAEILTLEREGARHDVFTILAIEEHCIKACGSVSEETSRRLLRLATEAGPEGTVYVTAADIDALWGYVPPLAEAVE